MNKKSKLLFSYLMFLLIALIVVNVLQFLIAIFYENIGVSIATLFKEHLPNLIAFLFVIKMLWDRKKLVVILGGVFYSFLIIGTMISYSYGIIILCLAAILLDKEIKNKADQ